MSAQPIAGGEAGEARTAAVVARTVDVIIAAWNRSDTIERAILSALAEPEVRHVIVVDDGSSDDTAARAAQCGAKKGRVIVEQLPSNLGPAAARNVALKISTAPWVAVLDGDASISARHDKRDLERLRDSDLGLTTNYKSIFHPERTSGAEEALFKCGLSRSVGCRDRGGQVPQIRATWIF